MLGAIIGDIAGSRFEFDNYRHTDFDIFSPDSDFTDDTICTVAIADWVLQGCNDHLASILQGWCRAYPCPKGAYGGRFSQWIEWKDPAPYNSWGNGSAMRVSAVGWAFATLEETLHFAEQSAAVTHNHPEGIKGAQAVAAAVFWARTGMGKAQIKENITRQFGYDLSQSCDQIRPHYHFNESCQETVPQAITAFLESDNFEHAIRLAVSLGGDSDTLAAITGSIAEAYYGIPASMREHALAILPRRIAETLLTFESKYQAV
ncbi:ADP-ribosylglycohydrolase family protein [Neisseria subflava]|uniref:ADP-ribosylglycohydrolase family protein n=1 Tax=Neisseria subflava TaxID=28449 RepID=UPI00280AC903|nr:ADP-ribosylglycohydrolase family protein [Neisseria subflava]